jgi:RimJ/RimL family protein N-acetyltransferase
MAVIVETDRLLLRTWESDDSQAAFEIWGDPEVMRYVGKPFASLDAACRTIERAAEAQRRHGVCLWAVVEKASSEVVGASGFHFSAEGPEFELAYHFKRKHWGHGFATEAVHACVRYARETLAATRIVAGVDARNAASRRVLEKAGFQYERLERDNGVDEECFSLRFSPASRSAS